MNKIVCKGCVGPKCKYYSSFYATTSPDKGEGKFHEFCMYDDKIIFDKKSHICGKSENDIVLKGGFKDTILEFGVSSKDIELLINKIYKNCMHDRRVSFITEREISKLNDIMKDWRRFHFNDDISFTKSKLWIKYQELTKFIQEIRELDDKFANIWLKYEHKIVTSDKCYFKDLSIGDTFKWGLMSCVKIGEHDTSKGLSKQPSNLIVIDAPDKDKIGHYCTLYSNAKVKLVKSKDNYDGIESNEE